MPTPAYTAVFARTQTGPLATCRLLSSLAKAATTLFQADVAGQGSRRKHCRMTDQNIKSFNGEVGTTFRDANGTPRSEGQVQRHTACLVVMNAQA